jgi:hypothetical protein
VVREEGLAGFLSAGVVVYRWLVVIDEGLYTEWKLEACCVLGFQYMMALRTLS